MAFTALIDIKLTSDKMIYVENRSTLYLFQLKYYSRDKTMKGQSEIAYLPKFANMMLIVMVIVITEILYIILIFDCFENQ